jgi:hypothetical protein
MKKFKFKSDEKIYEGLLIDDKFFFRNKKVVYEIEKGISGYTSIELIEFIEEK